MTFTINIENNISAFATQEEAAAYSTNPFESFTSQKELAQLAAAWPTERLVAIWNSLPGVEPVTTFKTAKAGAGKVLGEHPGFGRGCRTGQAEGRQEGHGRRKGRQGHARQGQGDQEGDARQETGQSQKDPKKGESTGPREGSKTAQVVAMLQRKNGASYFPAQKSAPHF